MATEPAAEKPENIRLRGTDWLVGLTFTPPVGDSQQVRIHTCPATAGATLMMVAEMFSRVHNANIVYVFGAEPDPAEIGRRVSADESIAAMPGVIGVVRICAQQE